MDLPSRSRVQLGTTATAIYTAPATATGYGILRTVQITNESANSAIFTLGIVTGSASASDALGQRLFYNTPLAANSTIEWTGFMPVMGAVSNPDIFYGLANVASTVTITAGIIVGP